MRSFLRPNRLALALLLAAVVATALPLVASRSKALAHPLGNFTINRYARIELSQQEIRLRYVLDMAEIPTFQERDAIDRDGDGQLSDGERAAYVDRKVESLRQGLDLKIDDKQVDLRAVTRELSFPPGQGGLDTERIVADFAASAPGGAPSAMSHVTFRDQNYEDRIGWREVVVRALDGVRLEHSSVPAQDVSDELRAYPKNGISNPLHVSSATFDFSLAPGANSTTTGATASAAQPAAAARDRAARGNPDSTLARFANLIAKDRLSAGVVIIALLAAFGFGAIHALSPGHGKTIVAAYLVGSKGTWRQALLLALTVTATHTSSVYALGLVTLYVSQYVLPEDLYPWLGIASGGLILTMGLALVATRLRSSGLAPAALAWLQRRVRIPSSAPQPALALATATPGAFAAPAYVRVPGGTSGSIDHGHDGAERSHVAHTHDHGLGLAHDHQHDGSGVSWRSLIGLGVFGGLLPCPSAIVVMVSAVALHRIAFGLILIVAFSFGLAAVLSGLGLFLVYAGALSQRLAFLRPAGARAGAAGGLLSFAMRAFPVGSAAAVVAAGAVVTLRALAQQGFL